MSDIDETTPSPAPAPPPRRLTRVREDKIIAGVCTGLGKYFGVDPVVVRLLMILLSFLGGAGVAAYVAAWIIVPLE